MATQVHMVKEKCIREKYKDVLSMDTEEFKDMMAINMIWMSETLQQSAAQPLTNQIRMNNVNMERLIQLYKSEYGRDNLEKRYV